MVEGRFVKMALMGDIHANLPALDAVLQDLPVTVDKVVCLGDIVGYYPDANEVCDRLRKGNIEAIRGNHDAYVTGALEPKEENRAAYRTDWTRQILLKDHFLWLKSLPTELEFRCDGKKIVVRHASPWDEETYLYPDSDRLPEICLGADEFLVIGHTHRPMERKAGRGMLVNPGSVGQPRDWNPEAGYCLLEPATGRVEFRRVAYDVTGFQEKLKKMDWDPRMTAVLSRVR
jgi:putative phosphoesterase